MPYTALVVNVMIASPGDVAAERQKVREVIHEWNAMHAERERIVLLPLGWETHASPLLGSRAQAVINEQVGDRADLLIGVFWTRLGTPTGEAASGTVEEVERHRAADRPVMLYFSNAPVRPDAVVEEQYRALRQFRERCSAEALVESYDTLAEFEEKLLRQLTHVVLQRFRAPEPSHGATEPGAAIDPARLRLGPEAERMLLAAADDAAGMVMFDRTGMGLEVATSEVVLCSMGSGARVESAWEAAVEQLARAGLLVDRGGYGEVFRITHEGYVAADALRARPEAAG